MDELRDHAREVKYALTEPRRLVDALSWGRKWVRQAGGGITILCPVHGERTPSCSVSRGPDGTIRVFCFGCGFAGDALRAIAVAHNLSESSDFREILAIGAEIAGQLALADEIRGGQVRTDRKPVPRPEPVETRTFPPREEVLELLRGTTPVLESSKAASMLHERGFDVELVDELKLARVVAPGHPLPKWASKRYEEGAPRLSWRETGHVLLLPVFDSHGALISVRGWRVVENKTPKRLPPSGYLAQPLVLANQSARRMLRGVYCPRELFIVEGEPDYLAAATTFGRADAVVGVNSGSWNREFAARVPRGTRVTIATHSDAAGDKYADVVMSSFEEVGLEGRAVWRFSPGVAA